MNYYKISTRTKLSVEQLKLNNSKKFLFSPSKNNLVDYRY